MSNPQILVFDSGVGGLSIINEIRQQLPHYSLTYASDNGFFPYGTKGEEELVDRVHLVLEACVTACQPDLIVVACNTASTVALPRVREYFNLEIVGVVPAIKPAASLSKTKTVGLLATPGTIKRAYTQQLITDFASDCRIIPVGSSELVQIAEKKLRREDIDLEQIRDILSPFFNDQNLDSSVDTSSNTIKGDAKSRAKVDTIVLACTHFPLLQSELQQCAPYPVQWVNSGDAIARRVNHLIQEHKLQPDPVAPPAKPKFRCLFTKKSADITNLLPALQGLLPGELEYLNIE